MVGLDPGLEPLRAQQCRHEIDEQQHNDHDGQDRQESHIRTPQTESHPLMKANSIAKVRRPSTNNAGSQIASGIDASLYNEIDSFIRLALAVSRAMA
jgi:hypothetical protein